jgi:N-acetylmuramoyl-L-alanine amidase-like protein
MKKKSVRRTQMVKDHHAGANESSIGIQHIGGEEDQLTMSQAPASVALIRWLIEQYDVPRTRIYGHGFAPGYNRPGGTSCPDKLFEAVYARSTIAACVEANL